jgi:diguanylate cyclase (GGDEF)-like protein/PAS domain S-box-containing protein
MDTDRCRFLLVEDNDDHAELFLAHLAETSFADAAVVRTDNLRDGRRALASGDIDIAFVDLTLPDSTVAETLEVLPELTPRASLIVITSLDDRDTLLRIIDRGADDCLPKMAINAVVLERTIRFNLDRRRFRQQAIQAERQKYDDLLLEVQRVGNVGFWELNIPDQTLNWSDEVFHIFEIPQTGAAPRYEEFLAAIHPEDRELVDTAYRRSLEAREPYAISHRLLMADGRVKFVLEQGKTLYADDGTPQLSTGTVLDITRSKENEEQLRLAASVFSHATEGVMITDPSGVILDVNEAFTEITGYSRDDALGKTPRLLKSGKQNADFYRAMWNDLNETGSWSGEIWNRRNNGEIYPEFQRINAVRDEDGNLQHFVAQFADITQEKAHQRQLEYIAHYDCLTDLPNRVLLADRLKQAMAQEQRRGQHLAVTYLDLDGFKDINDTHGHDIGDRVLVALSTRFKDALREGDTIARIGGDEFVAVLIDLAEVDDSLPVLERLLTSAALPIRLDGQDLQVSASLGVTFFPQAESIDADQLLRQADQSMYQAKQAGKNCYKIFDAEEERSIRGHIETLDRAREALAKQEFVLYFQPKVNMRTGRVVGAEALIRWQHPEHGLLSPFSFLPAIENTSLAIELDEWVLNTALAQLRTWQGAGLDLTISVNITAINLQRPDFVDRLLGLLERHEGLDKRHIELEVIETSALDDMNHVSRVIERCRDLGIEFALDDFGTGYSSLAYLKRLPAKTLKIDKSFVRDIFEDPEDFAILEGVLGLAASFGREAVAEGVESIDHGAMLLYLGCELAQGYGIAQPMPAGELGDWVSNWRAASSWRDCPPLHRDDLPMLYAMVDHKAWVAQVEKCVFEGGPPPPLDTQHCRFGQWLISKGKERLGSANAFLSLVQMHEKIHLVARELLSRNRAGDRTGLEPLLGHLRLLRDGLVLQLMTIVKSIAKDG